MPSSPISPCPSCPANAARGHGCAVYSSSATDAQWAILEPLLPAPGSTAGRGGRPEKHCRRAIVDAILYIVVVCGNCRWSSHQPGRCPRCSPAGPAAGRGSASSTRCAAVAPARGGTVRFGLRPNTFDPAIRRASPRRRRVRTPESVSPRLRVLGVLPTTPDARRIPGCAVTAQPVRPVSARQPSVRAPALRA